jgi:hypothetical protein
MAAVRSGARAALRSEESRPKQQRRRFGHHYDALADFAAE